MDQKMSGSLYFANVFEFSQLKALQSILVIR